MIRRLTNGATVLRVAFAIEGLRRDGAGDGEILPGWALNCVKVVKGRQLAS